MVDPEALVEGLGHDSKVVERTLWHHRMGGRVALSGKEITEAVAAIAESRFPVQCTAYGLAGLNWAASGEDAVSGGKRPLTPEESVLFDAFLSRLANRRGYNLTPKPTGATD